MSQKYKTSRTSFFYNYVLAFLLLFFLIFILLISPGDFSLLAIWVCVPLIFLLLFEPEFVRFYRHYVLDEENMILIEGILSKKKLSIPYDQIAGVTVLKSVLGRILKFGDIKISGFKDEIMMKGIKNPDEVYKQVQEKIKSSKKKKK